MKPTQPIILHGLRLSGHCHRVEMTLGLLGLPHTYREVDFMAGEHKTAPYLAMNPFGQVPIIQDGDVTLTDSVAILVYLATQYDPARVWLPVDPVQAAQVQRWLSVAQGPVFNGPCVARLVCLFGADFDLGRARDTAHKLLTTLDGVLAHGGWLVGDRATLADAALYSYIAAAPEGGVSLSKYDHVRRWLNDVENLTGFIAMPKSAIPAEKAA